MKTNKWYWISCKKFTVGVETLDYIVIQAPPIVKTFEGQHIINLICWVEENFEDVKWKIM
jgi:hypothetical protein